MDTLLLVIFSMRNPKVSKNKKKKTRTIYIDDGRTIADMSGLYDRKPRRNGELPDLGRPRASLKEQAQTYFAAVKTMFLPMLMMIGGISLVFLILYLILELAS